MSQRFDPAERHSEDLIAAVDRAAKHIATAITQGFALMADAQTAALNDLAVAVNNIADAITAEIQALQNAVNAAASIQPDDSAAIEAQVAKLNTLTAALKTPLAPASVTAAAASIAPPASPGPGPTTPAPAAPASPPAPTT